MKPLVSIVVPAYNHEEFVGQAISSCIQQTYANIEVIIVNDGSTDNTATICKDFARKDERVIYLEQTNRGAHAAINEGVKKSRSGYVAVLNSDDIFEPTKIERCVNIVQASPEINLVFGKIELIDRKGRPIRKGVEADWLKRAYDFFGKTNNLPLSVLNENFVATTSNMFFTKGLWKAVGGFQALRYCHDLDFLLASFRVGRAYCDIQNTHIEYRIHPSNTIKEDILNVRMEIAAVIAVHLCEYQLDLLGRSDKKTIGVFAEFLDNKQLSPLIIFFMMAYLKFKNKIGLYKMLQDDNTKAALKSLLD